MHGEIKKVNDRGMEVCKPFVFPATGVKVDLDRIANSDQGFLYMDNSKRGENYMIPTVNVFDPAIRTAHGIGLDGNNDTVIERIAETVAAKFTSIINNNVALVANNGLFPFLATYVVDEKTRDLIDIYHNYIGSGYILEPGYVQFTLFKEIVDFKAEDFKPRMTTYITPKIGDDAVYFKFTTAMSDIVYRISGVYNTIITQVINGLIVDFTAISTDAMKADNIDRKDLAITADQAYASAIINEIAAADIEKIREITYYNMIQIYSEYFSLIGFPGYFLDSTKMPN